MRGTIVRILKERLAAEINPRNPLKYLIKINPEEYIDEIVATVYLYTRPKKDPNKTIYFAEIISAIGHGLRKQYKLRRDSALAAKTGAFLLYTFEELGLLKVQMGQGKKGHGAFIVTILDDEGIVTLWNALPTRSIKKLPSGSGPFAPLQGFATRARFPPCPLSSLSVVVVIFSIHHSSHSSCHTGTFLSMYPCLFPPWFYFSSSGKDIF